MPCQEGAECIQYWYTIYIIYIYIYYFLFYVQTMFHWLRTQRCTFFELQYFPGESSIHQSVLFSKYVSMSWTNIAWCIPRNNVQFWRTYFTWLQIPCVFSFQQYHLLWKGRCMRKRIHFWHRSRHVLGKWNALPFEKKCTCWREHSFQRDAKVI